MADPCLSSAEIRPTWFGVGSDSACSGPNSDQVRAALVCESGRPDSVRIRPSVDDGQVSSNIGQQSGPTWSTSDSVFAEVGRGFQACRIGATCGRIRPHSAGAGRFVLIRSPDVGPKRSTVRPVELADVPRPRPTSAAASRVQGLRGLLAAPQRQDGGSSSLPLAPKRGAQGPASDHHRRPRRQFSRGGSSMALCLPQTRNIGFRPTQTAPLAAISAQIRALSAHLGADFGPFPGDVVYQGIEANFGPRFGTALAASAKSGPHARTSER